MDNGIGLGDLLAVMNNRDNDGWGGNWIWMIVLFLIFAVLFRGDALFGGRGTPSTAFTSTEFTLNNIERQIQGVQKGICDSTYALNNSILGNRYEIGQDLCNGFHGVNDNISQLGYQMQNCCYSFLAA